MHHLLRHIFEDNLTIKIQTNYYSLLIVFKSSKIEDQVVHDTQQVSVPCLQYHCWSIGGNRVSSSSCHLFPFRFCPTCLSCYAGWLSLIYQIIFVFHVLTYKGTVLLMAFWRVLFDLELLLHVHRVFFQQIDSYACSPVIRSGEITTVVLCFI